ncbi:hypothetical protein D3C71_1608860 [compost metagenome]
MLAGLSACQSSRDHRASLITCTPEAFARHRPSGDAYRTPTPSADTIESALMQACSCESFTEVIAPGLAPVMMYGCARVPTNSDCPKTPRPTMGVSVVIWNSTGQANGRYGTQNATKLSRNAATMPLGMATPSRRYGSSPLGGLIVAALF